MSIEILPNELLLECFQYLDGMDIYYSFDQFCMMILRNPNVRKQIYSLQLSNENICQIYFVLSHVSIEMFTNLRSLTLVKATENDLFQLVNDLTTYTQLLCFRLINCKISLQEGLFLLSTFQLQILMLPSLFWEHQVLWHISSVRSLTIDFCHLVDVHKILNNAHVLKYLNIYCVESNF